MAIIVFIAAAAAPPRLRRETHIIKTERKSAVREGGRKAGAQKEASSRRQRRLAPSRRCLTKVVYLSPRREGEREERNIFSSVITSLFSFPSCGGLLFPAVTANGRRHLLFVDDA